MIEMLDAVARNNSGIVVIHMLITIAKRGPISIFPYLQFQY